MINETIRKFGHPATLIRNYRHWVVLLRPAQVTAGSLVLAAKGDATSYGELPQQAFIEQGAIVAEIEAALRRAVSYERINYLMLMMVDPNVHFHVIPRYAATRRWNDIEFPDAGWPGPPQLGTAIQLTPEQITQLSGEISSNFR